MSAGNFDLKYSMNEIGKPVDPMEWGMTPTVAFESSKLIIQENKYGKIIHSAGCEITVNTPPENLKAMRRAAQ